MKTIKAWEYKDLTPHFQEFARNKELENEIEFQLDFLGRELEKGDITEKQYYDELGCSKYYAESTAWFVPACYYEHNKELVDSDVDKQLAEMLFTENGVFIEMMGGGVEK